MKKFILVLIALCFSVVAFMGPASATGGSDSPIPYTVDASGITLPTGDKFKAHGHVNIKYIPSGDHSERSAGIHFDPNNDHPGKQWIGKSNIPWSGFGLSGNFCVTWVQVAGYNQHFGEGGQEPFCVTTTPPPPDPDNKKVTICHYNESGGYNRIEVSVRSFYTSGHINHNKDIWESFTYTTVGGGTTTVPAQGDTSLLAFENCVRPPQDTLIDVDYTFVDRCGTAEDSMTVPAGTGYTVSPTVKDGLTWSITVTADTGYKFADGTKVKRFTHTFTDEDCDLPETGGMEKNVMGAVAAVILLVAAVAAFVAAGRKKN